MTDIKKQGIIAAGNWIVDHIKSIDVYPKEDSLANITNEFFNNGGSPYNILKDLSKMGAEFPLKGIGLVGNDTDGNWIINDCKQHNIDTNNLAIVNSPTSYTDVMVVESTGRRTFFHQRGANRFLDIEHFNFSKSKEKMFHLGYLLLLDKLDEIDSKGVTNAAKVLKMAQNFGLKTSIDIVSENSARFHKIILPSLPNVNYLFINEFEAQKTTEIKLNGDLPEFNLLSKAAKKLISMGVNDWVFIHFPFGVYACNKTGKEIFQGSVKLPNKEIRSVVGAGDALAAGILWGLHEDWSIEDTLKLGVCSAASSIQDFGCSDGIVHYKDCLKLGEKYSFYSF